MKERIEASGRCLCGAVTFKVAGAPLRMAQCHCKDCQRSSGTGHMSNAIFKASDVTIEGETRSYAVTADSGNTLTRHFCPTCGARLFSTNSAREGLIIMTAGAFDDSSWFAPETILYVRNRPTWDVTTESVPNYEGMPPLPPKS